MKTRITISVDKNILKKFKNACKDDGTKVSTKIEKFMADYIDKYKFNILKV